MMKMKNNASRPFVIDDKTCKWAFLSSMIKTMQVGLFIIDDKRLCK